MKRAASTTTKSEGSKTLKGKTEAAPKPAATLSAGPGRQRSVKRIIADLDVGSLNETEISEILLHFATHLRKRIAQTERTFEKRVDDICYLGSGNDVTLYRRNNPTPIGRTTEKAAEDAGIHPCG